ncbi:ATP-binding cassette sub-family A member 1, partial [Trichonephila inaurata madagascariensis]
MVCLFLPCTCPCIRGERESVRLPIYWGSGPLLAQPFPWDLLIVLATSIISAAIVSAFGLPAFYHRENFRAVYTLIFLYGWATTPLTLIQSLLQRREPRLYGHLHQSLVRRTRHHDVTCQPQNDQCVQ